MHSGLLCQFLIEFPMDSFSGGKRIDGNLIKGEGKGHGSRVSQRLTASLCGFKGGDLHAADRSGVNAERRVTPQTGRSVQDQRHTEDETTPYRHDWCDTDVHS